MMTTTTPTTTTMMMMMIVCLFVSWDAILLSSQMHVNDIPRDSHSEHHAHILPPFHVITSFRSKRKVHIISQLIIHEDSSKAIISFVVAEYDLIITNWALVIDRFVFNAGS